MKAVKRFKNAIAHKRSHLREGILGGESCIVQSPLSLSRPEKPPEKSHHHKARSVETHDRHPIEGAFVAGGVNRDINHSLPASNDIAVISPTSPGNETQGSPRTDNTKTTKSRHDLNGSAKDNPTQTSGLSQPWPIQSSTQPKGHRGKGQAHKRSAEYSFLAIGPSGDAGPPDPPAVSESPPAAEMNIYETAYHIEVQRIREKRGEEAKLYLTRRVDKKKEYRADSNMIGIDHEPRSGFARILDRIKGGEGKEKKDEGLERDGATDGGYGSACASTSPAVDTGAETIKREGGFARIIDLAVRMKGGEGKEKKDEARKLDEAAADSTGAVEEEL